MAERGKGRDRGQHEYGERHSSERHQNESRERENDCLRARLDELASALDTQQRRAHESLGAGGLRRDGAGTSPGVLGNALSVAFRVLSEFVAAVIVGAFIGWGIDRLVGTSPVFLILFLLMGGAAGFWNVYRIATGKPGSATR